MALGQIEHSQLGVGREQRVDAVVGNAAADQVSPEEEHRQIRHAAEGGAGEAACVQVLNVEVAECMQVPEGEGERSRRPGVGQVHVVHGVAVVMETQGVVQRVGVGDEGRVAHRHRPDPRAQSHRHAKATCIVDGQLKDGVAAAEGALVDAAQVDRLERHVRAELHPERIDGRRAEQRVLGD